jgi:flagellar FliL protein
MSSEANEKSEAEAPAKKKKLPLVLAVVGAVVVGTAGGVFVAGPMLAGKAPAHGGAAADQHGGASGEEESGGEAVAKPVYQIDNLVLNPAGTEGTRFLMATVAVQVPDEAAMALMKERDLELRDAILRVLGTKTVQELADVTRRDTLKRELTDVLTRELPAKTVREVYLPQFVIQ